MAPVVRGLSHLANLLATPALLQTSASQLDGVPGDLLDSVRFEGAKLIQAAGILLHLPQEIIAEAIIVFSRFWVGSEGGSIVEYHVKVSLVYVICYYQRPKLIFYQDVVSASLYLVAKPSAHPVGPRRLVSVISYLEKLRPNLDSVSTNKISPEDCFVSEGTYQDARMSLVKTEAQMLRVLGYQIHVALPYTLCINYLQALDVFNAPQDGQLLAKRVFAHLNTALLSPQLLYLTHQPCALATSAIYLAAKEVGVKLPAEEWWEVFDVDREELGFLVVALTSMSGFAEDETRKWSRKIVPLTADNVQAEIETRRMMDAGE